MFKPSTIVGLLLTGALVIAVYQVENKVQSMRSELKQLNAQIKQDKETIRVLHAEWAYLNRPDRIREMAGKLGMDYVSAAQVKNIEDIPMRAVMISANDIDNKLRN